MHGARKNIHWYVPNNISVIRSKANVETKYLCLDLDIRQMVVNTWENIFKRVLMFVYLIICVCYIIIYQCTLVIHLIVL